MSTNYTLTVHGAGKEIGRSSFVLNAENEHILMDYGVKFTPEETAYPVPISVKLDAAILSHAHFDHSGFVPHLFVDNPTHLFTTKPTLELSKMLWADSMKIAAQEGETPAYDKAHIAAAETNTVGMHYRKPMDITPNARLEFFDAGHILGSAMSRIDIKNKSFVYSGDFMVAPMRLHNGADIKSIGKVDYLLMESTYGNRVHPDREKTISEFMAKIRETLDRGGHYYCRVCNRKESGNFGHLVRIRCRRSRLCGWNVSQSHGNLSPVSAIQFQTQGCSANARTIELCGASGNS